MKCKYCGTIEYKVREDCRNCGAPLEKGRDLIQMTSSGIIPVPDLWDTIRWQIYCGYGESGTNPYVPKVKLTGFKED